MTILGIALLVVFAIVSALLVFLVVIQDEGNDSLGGIFSGASNSAFGARSSSVIVKITYGLGAAFFVVALSLAILYKGESGNVEATGLKKAQEGAATEWWNDQNPPAAPAAPAAEGAQIQAPAEPVPAPSGSGN